MGRGRGKGKKQSASVDDLLSDEEDKVPAHRKRGRPLKPVTDENEEVEVTEKIEKDEENVSANVSNNDMKTQVITVNKRKRKRTSHVKEKIEPMKEENGIRAKSSSGDSVKSTGFRQNGSRRKSKPHPSPCC
ncbi:hypothetical protein L195_g020290 [Trifolium pratense]|uniref:Uncharacterized protein n=1 Tax=Trifolium pratense TaxID=57577 RepID=A0A2K3N1Y8_TRIPR|nr:uncharacterized protein LOC123892447 [Trifolium pratense]PNX97070.1 hypothetical protein L195_g020290 [Trifolium pratense]